MPTQWQGSKQVLVIVSWAVPQIKQKKINSGVNITVFFFEHIDFVEEHIIWSESHAF
jgi:hypothetical protein